MDLNIEGVGEVSGWSPPVSEVLSPGFRATMESLNDTFDVGNVGVTRVFIDTLFQKGYIIAKYEPEV